jgi:transposase
MTVEFEPDCLIDAKGDSVAGDGGMTWPRGRRHDAIRAHLAEFGIVAALGRRGVDALTAIVEDVEDGRIPELVRNCLAPLCMQATALREQIGILDRRLLRWQRSDETCKRLGFIPGVGPALTTALVASVADPKAFRWRDFAAWVGLVPPQ